MRCLKPSPAPPRQSHSIRINVVSPQRVSEALTHLGMDPRNGLPAAIVAQAYGCAVDGSITGQVIEPTA